MTKFNKMPAATNAKASNKPVHKSPAPSSTKANMKPAYKSKPKQASSADDDELSNILSAINQLKDSDKSEIVSAGKLTKQERRNLNKKNKATVGMANVVAVKATPTESVYKRETVYPPIMSDFDGPWDRFLTPADEEYETVVETCYKGLVVSAPEEFSKKFHAEFDAALEGLDVDGFYQYDVTQPQGLGTKVAKTFVTRCLIGDAGTTYKYLGLRMFSVPWNVGKDEAKLTTPHAVAIGKLNQRLIEHTTDLLKKDGKPKHGSCQYNLTLVNRCFPESKSALKTEPGFEKDKCTVSWHADSTLDHFSTIGVYHCTSPLPCAASTSAAPSMSTGGGGKGKGGKGRNDKRSKSALGKRSAPDGEAGGEAEAAEGEFESEGTTALEPTELPAENVPEAVAPTAAAVVDEAAAAEPPAEAGEDLSWRLALRVWYDAEGPNATKAITSRAGEMQTAGRLAPALAVPLPSGAAYFLLDDFNHQHQHSVLAGNTYRYASTHRVCKTEGHTFQSVMAKTNRLLQVTGKLQYSGKNIRLEQLMMNEIEFEWLRQFYIQGERHRALHVWWHEPMKELFRVWGELEGRTIAALEVLQTAASFNYQNKFDQATPSPDAAVNGSEVSAEARAERKKWVRTLQRVECVDVSSYLAMIEGLKERQEKRVGWLAREGDGIFSSLSRDCAPLPCPLEDRLLQQNNKPEASLASPLPRVTSLLNMVQCVEQWLKAFETNKSRTAAAKETIIKKELMVQKEVTSSKKEDSSKPVVSSKKQGKK